MSDHSRRKHAKAVARREMLAARRRALETRANAVRVECEKRERYPDFVETGDAPKAFVELVRGAASRIDFDDRAIFSEAEASFYRSVRTKGAKAASEEFRQFQTQGLDWRAPGPDSWPRKLGHLVFESIAREQLLPFVPCHDFLIAPHRQHILVQFRSLIRVETPRGPFWHSTHKPTVLVNGRRMIVGFHEKHVIQERAIERLVPGGWFNYDGMGELFAYFHECQEFEVTRLYPNQTALSFFDDCAPGFWSRKIAVEVLGCAYRAEADYSYRVGYCPTFIHDQYIVAKTLLPPGYCKTPEYGKILSARLPKDEKDRMKAAVDGLTIHTFVETQDFSLLRWFHEQGIPQVINRRTAYRPA